MTAPETRHEQAEVFRRRRFAAPHRQRRLWLRLLRPLAAALLIVGIPAAASLWAATSPVFRVDDLVISSTGRVSPELARERLEALRGRHILMIRLEDVERALGKQVWLRGVEISKKIPSRLEVRLLERRSVALLRTAGDLFFLDAYGEVIAPYDVSAGYGDYVVVIADSRDGAVIREALAVAETWSEVAGPWAADLSEIEAIGAVSFRVYAAEFEFPLLVTRAQLAAGLEALRRHLPTIRRYYPAVQMADLRFSGQIVFQPAAGPLTEG